MDLAGGSSLTSECGTVGVVVSDVDAVGCLSLKLMGNGSDKPIDALPSLWECNFDHALRSSSGLVVKVESNLLGKNMALITKLLGWGPGYRVGVDTVVAVTGVNMESTKRRSNASTERVCFLHYRLRVSGTGSWHSHCEWIDGRSEMREFVVSESSCCC